MAGLYQSTKRSLNTGIITFVNYNTRVPPKVSQLTLAHEIGHNFGSPVRIAMRARGLQNSLSSAIAILTFRFVFRSQHDYPQTCRPGGLNGNYIMFASATSGDRPNNSKFSLCSVGNVSSVLDAIEENKKRNCFKGYFFEFFSTLTSRTIQSITSTTIADQSSYVFLSQLAKAHFAVTKS